MALRWRTGLEPRTHVNSRSWKQPGDDSGRKQPCDLTLAQRGLCHPPGLQTIRWEQHVALRQEACSELLQQRQESHTGPPAQPLSCRTPWAPRPLLGPSPGPLKSCPGECMWETLGTKLRPFLRVTPVPTPLLGGRTQISSSDSESGWGHGSASGHCSPCPGLLPPFLLQTLSPRRLGNTPAPPHPTLQLPQQPPSMPPREGARLSGPHVASCQGHQRP